jgi:hypothetical protein
MILTIECRPHWLEDEDSAIVLLIEIDKACGPDPDVGINSPYAEDWHIEEIVSGSDLPIKAFYNKMNCDDQESIERKLCLFLLDYKDESQYD